MLYVSDPKQLERRLILDTYTIFGCEDGEPTFKYTLQNCYIDVETGLSAEMMKGDHLRVLMKKVMMLKKKFLQKKIMKKI